MAKVPLVCPVCRHAAHIDLVCGFRPVPGQVACLCVAMDGMGPKSALYRLNQFFVWKNSRPLYVVVYDVLVAALGFGLGKLLIRLFS